MLCRCKFGFKRKLVTRELFCNGSDGGLEVSLARGLAAWVRWALPQAVWLCVAAGC